MLYFVSTKRLDGVKIYPRIPQTAGSHEDSSVARICVSESLLGAVQTTSIYLKYMRFYVYTVDTADALRIYTPTTKQVADAYIYGEKWLLDAVTLRLLKTVYVQKELVTDTITHYKIQSKDEEISFGFYDDNYPCRGC